jgi:hypothetical protein
MSDSVGYQVVTPTGESVGTVSAETEAAYLVSCGGLRKRRRLLPKDLAIADDSRDTVVLAIPKDRLLKSPDIGDRDAAAQLDAYWGGRG